METSLSIITCEKLEREKNLKNCHCVKQKEKKGCTLSALWKEALKISPALPCEAAKDIHALYSFGSCVLNKTD